MSWNMQKYAGYDTKWKKDVQQYWGSIGQVHHVAEPWEVEQIQNAIVLSDYVYYASSLSSYIGKYRFSDGDMVTKIRNN